VLLRDRFHYLADGQVETLAQFGAGCGGVLMTSDDLAALSPQRAALFADLLRRPSIGCDFPLLGIAEGSVEQHIHRSDGSIEILQMNVQQVAD
jgi:hypothetical protein